MGRKRGGLKPRDVALLARFAAPSEAPSRPSTLHELRRDLNQAAIAISTGLELLADVSRRYGRADIELPPRSAAPLRAMTLEELAGVEDDWGAPIFTAAERSAAIRAPARGETDGDDAD